MLLLFVFALGRTQSARAGLEWEQKRLEFHPGVSETEVIAHFRFRNTGPAATIIRSVATSCHCTTAVASKESYAPGEKGEITAKFSLEDRMGMQTQEIAVETDEAGATPTILDLVATIPKLAQIEPDPLTWPPGLPLEPKRLRVIPANGVPLRLTAVQSSDPGVSARIEPGPRAGESEVVVTPRGDHRAFSATLRIATDFPKDHPKALLVHVQVAP